MSELINKTDNRATIRWKLLTSASALVLTAYVSSADLAHAEDGGHPQVWIELGGQLSRLQDSQEIFAPGFVALTPSNLTPPQKAEQPPLYGIDETGKISFQPDNSSWTFSASIRYGRASSSKHVRHQSYPTQPYDGYTKFHNTFLGVPHSGTAIIHVAPLNGRFTDAVVKQSENHVILDFQAGKDLGLGLFGQNATSSLGFGVRIAQFRSKSHVKLQEDPDWHFQTHISTYKAKGYYYAFDITRKLVGQPYHSFAATFRADRSFKGLGPSISWTSTVPLAGNTEDGALSLDWGLNAALLFGRQKTKTLHQAMEHYHQAIESYTFTHPGTKITVYNPPDTPHTRSRDVTVPNIGGFAGISFNYPDAKVSLGYRADFFFNAVDGGIDARKEENRAFFGPYASISFGLGD